MKTLVAFCVILCSFSTVYCQLSSGKGCVGEDGRNFYQLTKFSSKMQRRGTDASRSDEEEEKRLRRLLDNLDSESDDDEEEEEDDEKRMKCNFTDDEESSEEPDDDEEEERKRRNLFNGDFNPREVKLKNYLPHFVKKRSTMKYKISDASISELAAKSLVIEKEIQKKLAEKLEKVLKLEKNYKELKRNKIEMLEKLRKLEKDAKQYKQNDLELFKKVSKLENGDKEHKRNEIELLKKLKHDGREHERTNVDLFKMYSMLQKNYEGLRKEMENSPWKVFQSALLEHARKSGHLGPSLAAVDVNKLESVHRMTPEEREAFLNSLKTLKQPTTEDNTKQHLTKSVHRSKIRHKKGHHSSRKLQRPGGSHNKLYNLGRKQHKVHQSRKKNLKKYRPVKNSRRGRKPKRKQIKGHHPRTKQQKVHQPTKKNRKGHKKQLKRHRQGRKWQKGRRPRRKQRKGHRHGRKQRKGRHLRRKHRKKYPPTKKGRRQQMRKNRKRSRKQFKRRNPRRKQCKGHRPTRKQHKGRPQGRNKHKKYQLKRKQRKKYRKKPKKEHNNKNSKKIQSDLLKELKKLLLQIASYDETIYDGQKYIKNSWCWNSHIKSIKGKRDRLLAQVNKISDKLKKSGQHTPRSYNKIKFVGKEIKPIWEMDRNELKREKKQVVKKIRKYKRKYRHHKCKRIATIRLNCYKRKIHRAYTEYNTEGCKQWRSTECWRCQSSWRQCKRQNKLNHIFFKSRGIHGRHSIRLRSGRGQGRRRIRRRQRRREEDEERKNNFIFDTKEELGNDDDDDVVEEVERRKRNLFDEEEPEEEEEQRLRRSLLGEILGNQSKIKQTSNGACTQWKSGKCQKCQEWRKQCIEKRRRSRQRKRRHRRRQRKRYRSKRRKRKQRRRRLERRRRQRRRKRRKPRMRGSSRRRRVRDHRRKQRPRRRYNKKRYFETSAEWSGPQMSHIDGLKRRSVSVNHQFTPNVENNEVFESVTPHSLEWYHQYPAFRQPPDGPHSATSSPHNSPTAAPLTSDILLLGKTN